MDRRKQRSIERKKERESLYRFLNKQPSNLLDPKKILFTGKYHCDCGSLMLYSSDWECLLPNIYGDGTHIVTVVDDLIIHDESLGTINVTKSKSVWISKFDTKKKPLFLLPTGLYMIGYRDDRDGGDMLIEKVKMN